MEIVGTGEMRQNVASILNMVADGEAIIVGKHGEYRAAILPPVWAEFFADEEIDNALSELRKEFPDATDFEIMKFVLVNWGKADTSTKLDRVLELVEKLSQK